MRKHRLAERLLTDVIGLDWALVHDEACRWEHVISDDVERRLVAILDGPMVSPYGNPIPGLAELGVPPDPAALSGLDDSGAVALAALPAARTDVVVVRLAEPLQAEHDVMAALHRVGALPGAAVMAEPIGPGVRLRGQGATLTLSAEHAQHVYVRHAS